MIYRKLVLFVFLSSLSGLCAAKTPLDTTRMASAATIQTAAPEGTPLKMPTSMTIETIFGKQEVTDAIVIELLHHPAVTRLKGVDHHGPASYICKTPTYTRYDHSLGVYALLKKFNVSLTLQVAGLLHDASHTIFSHLADRFFKTGNQHAYQDKIHAWYLEQMGVDVILKKYGFDIEDMMPEQYKILKNGKYMLSADRIQYNLQSGFSFGRLTQEQVDTVLSDLRLEGETWFFTTTESAFLLADQSVHFTRHCWSSELNVAQHHWMTSALKQLVARDLVSSQDIHFGQDQKVVDLFMKSTDKHVMEMVEKCRNPEGHYKVVTGMAAHDLADYPKFRGVNPPVKQEDDSHVLLTELHPEFKKEYDAVKQYCQQGIKIKFIEANEPQ